MLMPNLLYAALAYSSQIVAGRGLYRRGHGVVVAYRSPQTISGTVPGFSTLPWDDVGDDAPSGHFRRGPVREERMLAGFACRARGETGSGCWMTDWHQAPCERHSQRRPGGACLSMPDCLVSAGENAPVPTLLLSGILEHMAKNSRPMQRHRVPAAGLVLDGEFLLRLAHVGVRSFGSCW
jgi:hypothetical protein